MQKLRHSGLSKLIVAVVMALILVPSALAYTVGIAPLVTSSSATPSPYDPTSTTNFGEVTIQFYVNTDVNATVKILDVNHNVIPANTTNTPQTTEGTYSFKWDGKVSGTVVAAGTYFYQITVSNNYGSSTVTGPIAVAYASTPATCTNPVISNDYASPTPFNPDNQNTSIYYTLNTAAQVTVDVRYGTSTVATIGPVSKSAGANQTSWNGTGASEGMYTYKITAHTTTCGDAVETGNVEVDTYSNQSGAAPIISDNTVSPNPFDPDNGDTKITFDIDRDANITLEILDGSSVVRTLATNVARTVGTVVYHWNGNDSNSDRVDNGTYKYRIRASNAYGTDSVNGTVRVSDSTNNNNNDNNNDFEDDYGNLISNVSVTNDTFNPDDGERAKLIFDVEEDNVDVQVNVINEDENSVRELIYDKQYDQSTGNGLYWNGRDDSNDILDDDVYLFKIEADKGSQHEVAYRYVEVDTDGNVIGFPDDTNNNGSDCAGFTDVSHDNPYCKAIELMKIKGIFTGYPDGTFRISSPINRAETVKVVLLAIDRYTLMSDNGANLGFWDVTKRAWYMPYLRTAQTHGMIEGYPDGSFRPTTIPNKVELLKVFLEGTGINIPACNSAPYKDTPVNRGTRWYVDYVCFAASNGLISADADGYFHPDQPMNRGDVAMLFYNFYVRGMYRQTPYYSGSNSSYSYDTYGSYNYNNTYNNNNNNTYDPYYSDPYYTGY
jgi:flagellar hook assembly protein FlgD